MFYQIMIALKRQIDGIGGCPTCIKLALRTAIILAVIACLFGYLGFETFAQATFFLSGAALLLWVIHITAYGFRAALWRTTQGDNECVISKRDFGRQAGRYALSIAIFTATAAVYMNKANAASKCDNKECNDSCVAKGATYGTCCPGYCSCCYPKKNCAAC